VILRGWKKLKKSGKGPQVPKVSPRSLTVHAGQLTQSPIRCAHFCAHLRLALSGLLALELSSEIHGKTSARYSFRYSSRNKLEAILR